MFDDWCGYLDIMLDHLVYAAIPIGLLVSTLLGDGATRGGERRAALGMGVPCAAGAERLGLTVSRRAGLRVCGYVKSIP